MADKHNKEYYVTKYEYITDPYTGLLKSTFMSNIYKVISYICIHIHVIKNEAKIIQLQRKRAKFKNTVPYQSTFSAKWERLGRQGLSVQSETTIQWFGRFN